MGAAVKRWTLIGVLVAMLAGCFEAIYRYVIDDDLGPPVRRP